MTRILFYRDLQYFSGGHLKVFHYFQHALGSKRYTPRIAFSPASLWDPSNPWRGHQDYRHDWDPHSADIVFLAGMDWQYALENGLREFNGPVVNLIQHVRHADPNQALYGFLSQAATRICVSDAVADAILATGKVNGPVLTIINGVESDPIAETVRNADATREPVLVLGTKRTQFAQELDAALRRSGVATTLHDRFIPRDEFLELLRRHSIVVCCPDVSEGFYLPALEAMARGAFVVCPDCVGNRGFCINEQSCLSPAYTVSGMVEATLSARDFPTDAFDRIRAKGIQISRSHSLARERESFLRVLDQIVGSRASS